MSYTKHNYQKGDELLASQLNDMDDQIALNEQTADTLVTVSNTQPAAAKNRVWVKATPSEIEIPTMEDHNELSRQITQLDRTLSDRTLYTTDDISTAFPKANKGYIVNSVGRYSANSNGVISGTENGTVYLYKGSTFMANTGYKLSYAFWEIPVFSDSNLSRRISFQRNIEAGVSITVPQDCYILISVMKSDESAFDSSLTAMQILQTAITINVYYREIKEYANEVPKLYELAAESITPINIVSFGLIWPDNIVNTANYTAHKKIKDTTGEIVDSDSYNLSDYFAIKPSTKYTVLGSGAALNIYDYSKNRVRTFYPSSTAIGTITTPDNAAFARMSNNSNPSKWQINEGETLKTYTPYTPIKISDEIVEPKKSNYYHGKLLANPADVSNRYFGLLTSYSTQVSLNRNTTYTQMIGMFDDLVTEANGYITKTDLGTASGLIGGSVPHVYKYTFKPKQIAVSGSTEIPVKILIDAAMHGFEKNSAYAWYFFLCDLVRNYKDNPSLSFIRSNVEIQIIPVLNPYGFENNTYTNGNAVNINRNFDTATWEYVATGEDASGAEPMDQPETQIVAAQITNNPTALIYINTHTNGQYYSNGYPEANSNIMQYNIADAYQCKLLDVIKKHVQTQTVILPLYHSDLTPDFDTAIGRNQSNTIGNGGHPGTFAEYAAEHSNVLGLTLELFNGLVVDNETAVELWSESAKKICSEMAGNLLLEVIAEYSR